MGTGRQHKRRSRRAAALTAVAAAVVAGAVVAGNMASAAPTSAPTPEPGARSIGDRLFPHLGNGGYDVQAYDVSYDYQPSTTKMNASVRIDARADQELSEFSLDSAGQQINTVKVGGAAAHFAVEGEKLVIDPAAALAKGRPFRVDIDFVADRSAAPQAPDRPASGHKDLSGWYDYQGKGFAVLGQPDRAHLLFPMNDHPSDKARVAFHITTPKDMTAVANGTLRSRTTEGDRTTYVYGTRDPIPTHVIQAAVGRFKEFTGTGPHGLPLRSFVDADVADQAKQVATLPDTLAWVEKQIGSPYPFETYGVLGVPEYGAALEAATLSTYAATGLQKDPAIIVHELVHQYFGDAVSVHTWDDMWLSEGHAGYYSFLYQDEKGMSSMQSSAERAYEFDKEERPIAGPAGKLKSGSDVLGSTNAAGFLMLYGLHKKVGDATFKKIEKTFFDRYRGRSATTKDYIEVVNEVTGHDFTSYVNDWIYAPTTPPMP